MPLIASSVNAAQARPSGAYCQSSWPIIIKETVKRNIGQPLFFVLRLCAFMNTGCSGRSDVVTCCRPKVFPLKRMDRRALEVRWTTKSQLLSILPNLDTHDTKSLQLLSQLNAGSPNSRNVLRLSRKRETWCTKWVPHKENKIKQISEVICYVCATLEHQLIRKVVG